MLRALLPFVLTIVVFAEPPQEKATAPPTSTAVRPEPQSPEPQANTATDPVASRMQNSLEKQRASARKQATGWISIGSPQPSETFILPWPKPAVPATSIALRAFMDSIPCDPVPEPDLERIVKDAAERQNVNPKLVRAMIAQESAGRPCAVSSAGAQGLMQLMPEVQRELAVDDPFDPRTSVEAGAKLLRTLIDRYAGDVPKALAAYNAGPGAVDRADGIPPIAETRDYVNKIVKKIE
jgi:soluble lytic murein transglycosylase-like protein